MANYKKIQYDGTKVQVDSAIRDGEGRKISTNYVKNNDLKAVTDKIPSEASSTNQLADKQFVNSSIATATATFQGTFDNISKAPTTADINDYVFITSTDAAGNTLYNRYKHNGTTWVFEYTLNNSSFTAAQWSAINSGVTSTKAAAWDGKYTKPNGGIPSTDLASSYVTIDEAETITGLKNFTQRPRLVTSADNYDNFATLSDLPSSSSLVSDADRINWNSKTSNTGTVTSVNNISPVGGNVTLSIPSKVSDLSDSSSYVKTNDSRLSDARTPLGHTHNKTDIVDLTLPTKLSDLTDDLGTSPTHTHSQYLTEHQSLSGYQTKITSSNKIPYSYISGTPTIPSGNSLVSTADRNNWNAKSNFSGDYDDLTNKPTIPANLSDLGDYYEVMQQMSEAISNATEIPSFVINYEAIINTDPLTVVIDADTFDIIMAKNTHCIELDASGLGLFSGMMYKYQDYGSGSYFFSIFENFNGEDLVFAVLDVYNHDDETITMQLTTTPIGGKVELPDNLATLEDLPSGELELTLTSTSISSGDVTLTPVITINGQSPDASGNLNVSATPGNKSISINQLDDDLQKHVKESTKTWILDGDACSWVVDRYDFEYGPTDVNPRDWEEDMSIIWNWSMIQRVFTHTDDDGDSYPSTGMVDSYVDLPSVGDVIEWANGYNAPSFLVYEVRSNDGSDGNEPMCYIKVRRINCNGESSRIWIVDYDDSDIWVDDETDFAYSDNCLGSDWDLSISTLSILAKDEVNDWYKFRSMTQAEKRSVKGGDIFVPYNNPNGPVFSVQYIERGSNPNYPEAFGIPTIMSVVAVGKSKSPIYKCTYGTTTFAQIKNACTQGLMPYVQSGNSILWLGYLTTTTAVFEGINSTTRGARTIVTCSGTKTWSGTSYNVSVQSGCLIEGTPITMADWTYKNIEDVQKGDMIKSYNPYTKQYCNAVVMDNICPGTTTDYEYHAFSDGSYLTIAHGHSVMTINDDKEKPTDINKLKPGDWCLNDKLQKVQYVGQIAHNRPRTNIPYYHLLVSNHCYFANGICNAFLPSWRNTEYMNAHIMEPLPDQLTDLFELGYSFQNSEKYMDNENYIKEQIQETLSKSRELIEQQNQYKLKLAETDYKVIKAVEAGIMPSEEDMAARQSYRDEINRIGGICVDLYQKDCEIRRKYYNMLPAAELALYNEIGFIPEYEEYDNNVHKEFIYVCKKENEALDIYRELFKIADVE